MSAGSGAGFLSAQPGNALRAATGPARTQTRSAAPAGRLLAGQPRRMRQQLSSTAFAGNRDDGPNPAAGQGKPLLRPNSGGAGWHGTHRPIFPCRATSLHRSRCPGPRCPCSRYPFLAASVMAVRNLRGRPGRGLRDRDRRSGVGAHLAPTGRASRAGGHGCHPAANTIRVISVMLRDCPHQPRHGPASGR